MTILDQTTLDEQLVKAYRGWSFDLLSDTALGQEVARSIRGPRRDPANSFVLHAPLELIARMALLPYVAPDHRDAARLRLFSLAGQFESFGPGVDEPPTIEFDTPEYAAVQLANAIDAGDLELVDATAAWLGTHADGELLRRLLADTVVPRLSAAAHGSILLYQLPRLAPRGEVTAELLRPLARELARYPSWRLHWPDQVATSAVADPQPGHALFDALARTPHIGLPGSDFIFPVMAQVDENGVAAEVLTDAVARVDLVDGARAILRAAAWSMLAEPDTYAPYGWTHCLTLPQAVLGVAGSCTQPRTALAIAATYVVGFRAAFATESLAVEFTEPAPHFDLGTTDIITSLASRAAVHADAHFAKYTLACIDAAHFDPTHARLYLAAADHLASFWAKL